MLPATWQAVRTMALVQRTDENRRTSSVAVWTSLGTGGVFEALTVSEIENKAAWAISPWKEDPYHTAVYLAQFAVPVLALLIVLRLLTQGALAEPDRAQQTVRAAGVMIALIGLTLAFEWAAVIAGANPSPWDAWTSLQVGGLAVVSVLAVGAAVLLVRRRQPRGSSAQWRNDWLGDVVLVCRRIPVLRRWATPEVVAWVRGHAMTVFVALSALAGLAITSAQAIGEGTADPVIIIWFMIVETSSNLAFCVISNAIAGFIARPRRTRARNITETSVVAGCLATLIAIAFHDSLWSAFTAGPLTTAALVSLTLGAGVVVSLATAALLLARASLTPPPVRGD
jgi:hypothetical protein